MTRRDVLVPALSLPILALTAWCAVAGSKTWFTVGGVAIRGYDAVAYFTEGRAVQGSPEHALKWMGALWYFASDENRTAFEMNPRAYAPQYGGYCAYEMVEGQRAPSAPEAFSIQAGKLYLHSSPTERSLWKEHAADNIARADALWPQSGQ